MLKTCALDSYSGLHYDKRFVNLIRSYFVGKMVQRSQGETDVEINNNKLKVLKNTPPQECRPSTNLIVIV